MEIGVDKNIFFEFEVKSSPCSGGRGSGLMVGKGPEGTLWGAGNLSIDLSASYTDEFSL